MNTKKIDSIIVMKKVFLLLGFFIIFFVLNLQSVNALTKSYHVGTANMISPSTDIEVPKDDIFTMQCSGIDDGSFESATYNWQGYLEYNTSITAWTLFQQQGLLIWLLMVMQILNQHQQEPHQIL